MTEQERLAKKIIDKCFFNWFSDDPILLKTATMVNWRADNKQETIGIDVFGRTPTINYNPNFINSLPFEHIEMVLVMEMFKILLRHATTRLLNPRHISALSSEITISELLNNEMKFIISGLNSAAPSAKELNLDPFSSFEYYFKNLNDQQQQTIEYIKQKWNSMSEKEKQDLLEKSKDQSNNEEESDPIDENGFKEYNNPNDAIKDYFDPNGTSSKDWGHNELFEAEIKDFINKNKTDIKQWGKYTGNSVSSILADLDPKISMATVLRSFQRSITTETTRPSRKKINRRFDLLIPGYKREYKSKLCVAVDVSGSMSDKDLKYGLALINKLCRSCELDYVMFDTEIKVIEKNYKNVKKEFKVYGRGGTSPECVFKMFDKNKYDGIIVFTDGEFSGNIQQPKAKVLWVLHSKDLKIPCKFGKVVHIDRKS